MWKLRSIIIVAVVLVFGVPPGAQAATVDTTFTFTGQCAVDDCTGVGVGTLVLSDYTQGDPIEFANFVSFTYTSNLLSLSFSDVSVITGTLPVDLPATANVLIEGQQGFQSDTTGAWSVTADVGGSILDEGSSSLWSVTPLPTAFPLFATGFGVIGLLGWRRKRKAAAIVA
jgi:hypothetical protein